MNIHPLIHLADTMPLDGYAFGTAHDALCREADGHWLIAVTPREQMAVSSAMTLAEYILHKRIAGKGIFPIPPSTKSAMTVRAKDRRAK